MIDFMTNKLKNQMNFMKITKKIKNEFFCLQNQYLNRKWIIKEMTITKNKRHVHKSTISLIINIKSELSSFKAFFKTTIRQNLMLSKVSLDLNKNSQLTPKNCLLLLTWKLIMLLNKNMWRFTQFGTTCTI